MVSVRTVAPSDRGVLDWAFCVVAIAAVPELSVDTLLARRLPLRIGHRTPLVIARGSSNVWTGSERQSAQTLIARRGTPLICEHKTAFRPRLPTVSELTTHWVVSRSFASTAASDLAQFVVRRKRQVAGAGSELLSEQALIARRFVPLICDRPGSSRRPARFSRTVRCRSRFVKSWPGRAPNPRSPHNPGTRLGRPQWGGRFQGGYRTESQ